MYIESNDSDFNLSKLCQDLKYNTRSMYKRAYDVVRHMEEKGEVKKHPTMRGGYSRTSAKLQIMTPKPDKKPVLPLPVPLDLHNYFGVKQSNVIVVGGGDSAMEEGLFLTRFASSVTIVHRRDELRAGTLLQKRAFNNPKIHFIWDSLVTEISGNDIVNQVKIKNVKSGEIHEQSTEGVFIFIGHTPNTELFQGQLEMDEGNYLVVNNLMETNKPGVFAAGEAADSHFRQVVTSAGMGAAAAIQATRYLETLD